MTTQTNEELTELCRAQVAHIDTLTLALAEARAMLNAAPACADPVVETNVALLRSRSAVGIAKYGTTVAGNKLPLRAWLNHALEETLDNANYLQRAMQAIDAAPAPATPAESNDIAPHDSEEREMIGARIKRVAKAAGCASDGDNADYYGCAFAYLGIIARKLEVAPQQHAQAAWIDASVTKPTEGALVLICGIIPSDVKSTRGLKGWRNCASFRDGDFLDANGCTMNSATHWMALPNSAHDGASQQPAAAPDLSPVIQWLENGCDPKEAAKELRLYQKALGLPSPVQREVKS